MLINVQGNHMILANQNWSIRTEKHNFLNWGFLKTQLEKNNNYYKIELKQSEWDVRNKCGKEYMGLFRILVMINAK